MCKDAANVLIRAYTVFTYVSIGTYSMCVLTKKYIQGADDKLGQTPQTHLKQ
jgi:hypothetical protein